MAFVDDYRLTSCISFLKLAQNRCRGILEPDMNSILSMTADNLAESSSSSTEDETPAPPKTPRKKVPSSCIEFALKKVEQFTLSRDHEDIDLGAEPQSVTTDEQWIQFIDQFYAASQ